MKTRTLLTSAALTLGALALAAVPAAADPAPSAPATTDQVAELDQAMDALSPLFGLLGSLLGGAPAA
ncbi:hypothetical protein [Streptomyces tsukubensis]|nr:hypothetical protein [Streptomyces tsukubensis]QFR95111.1 hypothetical protein GBW32_21415 [Streptomyces tsukubensis]